MHERVTLVGDTLMKREKERPIMNGIVPSACGVVEKRRTADHQTMSSSTASANVFVSLGKILSFNRFVDLSILGKYQSWEILQSKC